MTQDELYLAQCKRAGREIYEMSKEVPITEIVVYGSLARGHLGMWSDIDIMAIVDADLSEMKQLRKRIARMQPEWFEEEFPYIDFHVARREAYENPDDSEYGKYIRNCRRDGISIWRKATCSE